ncbi:hypothetical protein M9458_054002 [Cirrhinus mrigala]|uniref:ribonuclease H n=1 Tax=Cirrhinus mrigala TaxID=683832 RepID=A0ABD0MKN3_CIRMR
MATLRSRLSFTRRLPSSSSRGSSSSRKGFTAATARRLGDLQVTVQNVPPGKTPRASAPPRGPVVMPKQTAPPSKSGPSVSFGAPPEEEMSISASEGEQSAGEAGASAGERPSAVAVPSEADAELSAMLLRAAEGIGLEVPKVPPPDPSRLDDWFLGTRSAAPPRLPPVPFFPEVHDELVRAWRAPYSARSRPTSSSLATLDGGAARGYEGVPQVERILPRPAVDLRVGGTHPLTERAVFHISGPSAPGSVPERQDASSGSDSEPTFASAGTWEEGCPTAVTSVNAPLIPLAARLAAWLELPSPSRWLIRTAPAQVQGHPFHFCADMDASVLRAEIAVLLAKDAIEPVPPAEMKSGFYSPYFIVPKKSGGLRPILDLRVLNRSLLRLPFKMLTSKRILSCVRHQDWFAAIDLKDAYFHVSILPRHRPFLRFAFEGRAYQYKVLPFGLSLSPRVFTKVAEGALNPLWRKGIRILNYLDDWLIMAHSRDLLCEHRDLVLQHLSHLGLRVNREKSKLSPVQRISFLGMELDSVNMTACLTNERTQSVLSCLRSFRHKTAVPLKTFQRLLGHMAAAAAVTPLGLLHMRPLQRWLHDRVPRWAWHRGTLRIGVSPQCRRLFSPWSDPAFLRAGVPLGQVSRHVVVYTDASTTGWGAVCNGQAASGSWTGPRLLWHINCLELLAVLLALRRFLPMLRHKHVLVRTDNTATVAYINRQGGLRSRRMSQLARHLLLWSQKRLKSLRAVHIPGELNRAADQLSRQPTHPGEWRLHPQTVQLIWSRFGEAQIDLFASPESSHCQLYYSLSEAPLGRDALAHSWPPGPNLLAQTLCKIREDGEQVLLVAPYWPTRTCPSLEDSLEEGPSFSGDGHNLAPASRSMEPTRVASGRDTAVIETITQQAYALRWGLFVDWCASRGEDPQRCPIAVVLSFLQEKLERRLSPSTLKVYVAAIAAYHDAVDGASIGKHQLVVRFLRGARRVNPPRPHLVPSWDLSVALRGLRGPPFEPLVSVELKFLSLKTALLTALASIKRVGDLQAFSVNEACLEFGPADSHVDLRPRPGYVPKVPTTPFRDQVVNLQALPPEEADPALALLCPVRALRVYVDRTRSFRRSEQLFVCFGGQQKGNAVSKQRLAHWVVDAISLAYESQGEPCPLGVRAHSTRSVASSYALAHGASLADICRAAGWATPNTFARFYNLRVEPVSSRVLSCFICVFAVLVNKVCLQVTVEAVIDGSVVLPCSSTQHDLKLQDIDVYWVYSGSTNVIDIIKGEESEAGQDPRYKNRAKTFQSDAYLRGNFSIKLTALTHADAGKYTCLITHSSEHETVELIIKGV